MDPKSRSRSASVTSGNRLRPLVRPAPCHCFTRFVSIFVCGPHGPHFFFRAGVAQLVEQLICNHQVGGSSPFTGSSICGLLGIAGRVDFRQLPIALPLQAVTDLNLHIRRLDFVSSARISSLTVLRLLDPFPPELKPKLLSSQQLQSAKNPLRRIGHLLEMTVKLNRRAG